MKFGVSAWLQQQMGYCGITDWSWPWAASSKLSACQGLMNMLGFLLMNQCV